jgi:hypothetical protein
MIRPGTSSLQEYDTKSFVKHERQLQKWFRQGVNGGNWRPIAAVEFSDAANNVNCTTRQRSRSAAA